MMSYGHATNPYETICWVWEEYKRGISTIIKKDY